MTLDKKSRDRIAKAIIEKGATKPCPRCGQSDFTIAEDLSLVTLNSNLGSVAIGGPAIPVALVVCSNCGFLSQHAIGVLDLVDLVQKG